MGEHFTQARFHDVSNLKEGRDHDQDQDNKSGMKYQSSSLKGYLSRGGFNFIVSRARDKFLNDTGMTTIEALKNSEVEYVRLGKNLFESDEGQNFIEKHDSHGEDMIPNIIPINTPPELYLLLLKVPYLIGRDQKDFKSLPRIARTIAYGCGINTYRNYCNGSIVSMRDDLECDISKDLIWIDNRRGI